MKASPTLKFALHGLLAALYTLSLPLQAAAPGSSSEQRTPPTPGKSQQLTSPDQVPEGMAKSDWQSIRAAYEAGRHAFQPVEGGWQARNPGQQWTTKFDGRGFIAQPKGGADWQWGLELKSYGFAGNERAIGGADHKPAVKAEGQCLIPADSRQKTDSRDLMKTRSAPKSALCGLLAALLTLSMPLQAAPA